MLIDTLNNTFFSAFVLGRHVSYDEMTIESCSRYIPSIQYNPMKPHKWGLKLHSVNCATTGFLHRFEVYTGKYNLFYLCVLIYNAYV